MFKDIAYLIDVSYAPNSNGRDMPYETGREIYVDVRSVKRTEYYESLKIGTQLTLTFVTSYHDYNGESTLLYNGAKYRIERAYS